jgi:hypothetical protein
MARSTKACVTRALVGWGRLIFSGNWVGESILELLEAKPPAQRIYFKVMGSSGFCIAVRPKGGFSQEVRLLAVFTSSDSH